MYVVESKNYSGNIYGDGKRREWLQYAGKKKYKFYSPILQNQGHIHALRGQLDAIAPNLQYLSIIVFSARCKLKVKDTGDTIVLKRDLNGNFDMHKQLKHEMNRYPQVLTDEQIQSISDMLEAAQRPDDAIKDEHLRRLTTYKTP